jgi:hypothetical protein
MRRHLPFVYIVCVSTALGCRTTTLSHLGTSGGVGCVTQFIASPCRTVRSHLIKIQRGKWGLLDASVFTEEKVEAADSDYSTSITEELTWRRRWIFRKHRLSGTGVLVRPQDQIIVIDHLHRWFLISSGARMRGYQNWPTDDNTCNINPHYLYFEGRTPNTVLSGVPVIGYYWHYRKGHEGKMYFAPSFGCRVMLRREIVKNQFGLPTSYEEERIDSITVGVPDPKLFRVPQHYGPMPANWKFGDQFDPPGIPPENGE